MCSFDFSIINNWKKKIKIFSYKVARFRYWVLAFVGKNMKDALKKNYLHILFVAKFG
jgi:hypothetical protein